MLRFPTCFPSFRVVGEKQLPQEIIFLAWSPKRDLIALANTTGEVLLHRLASFHRVWSFPPNESTGKEVTCLAWRPDGKLLAFALADTKKIILCDVEKPESLHSFSVEAPVSCMHWTEVTVESSVLTSFYNAEDESNLLLPKLPTLPKNYNSTSKIFSEENSDEIIKLLGDVRLNILVLGGSSGFIELYAYGMFKIARVTGIAGTCIALCLSSDLKSLSVVTEVSSGGESEVSYFQLETNLLFPYYPRKSLHFVKRRMENVIDQCLQKPADVIGRSMNQAICIPLYKDARSMDCARRLLKFPFLWNNKTSNLHYLLFTILEDSVYKMCILRRHTDISQSVSNGLIGIKFGSFTSASADKVRRSSYSCLDAQFYDDETVTVILKDSMGREGRDRILVQLSLSLVYNSEDSDEYEFTGSYSTRLDEQGSIIPTRTMHFEKHWRLLESMRAQYVAGNGLRKVSCVLSSNLRHVRVFEMDVVIKVEKLDPELDS